MHIKKLGLTCLLFIGSSLCLAHPQTTTHHKKAHHKQESPLTKTKKKVDKLLTKITSNKESALQTKLAQQTAVFYNPIGIILYKPTYILPFYYTGTPYQSIYRGVTPNNQAVKRQEFKYQLSLLMPIWRNMFHTKDLSLNIAYTQVSFWQFYVKSQYFRETNYEPSLFLSYNFHKNWLFDFGGVHQSNGRGGSLERSWNRVYASLTFSGPKWLVSIKPWILVFKPQSSDLDNPDIADYLGHERIVLAYKFPHDIVTSLEIRNIEGGSKVTFQSNITFPLTRHISGMVQMFSGYGQSLIEYNHRTNSIGFGIAFNNWL